MLSKVLRTAQNYIPGGRDRREALTRMVRRWSPQLHEPDFGALGLFPNYYSLTQELSTRHQGIVTGALGCATWTCIAAMQHFVGQRVDQTGSYADGIFMVGLLPLVACAVLLALWGPAQGPACPDVKRL